MTQLDYFRLLAPAYEDMLDADVTNWLLIADGMVFADCLDDDKKAMAVALYAAHLIYTTSSDGASGPVTAEKEGDLSRSYGATVNDKKWLGKSSYGQLYLQTIAPCRVGMCLPACREDH